MAFQPVKKERAPTEYYSLTEDMAIGASIEGYLIDITNSAKYAGRYNVVLQEDGKEKTTTCSCVGNLHYLVVDGLLVPGARTRITREKVDKSKSNAKYAYEVLQDTENVIEVGPQTRLKSKDEAPAMADSESSEESSVSGGDLRSKLDKVKKGGARANA